MKTLELYQSVVRRLDAAGIPDAEIEAAFLLGHLLKMNRAQLFLAGHQEISQSIILELEQCLTRRLEREPLAYILGEQEFWSLPFQVTPDVLIPRPETEQLVEIVLATLKKEGAGQPGTALELGAGSGVIAVVLALELPEMTVYSIDRSFDALKIAGINAKQHAVDERVRFINADLLSCVSPRPFFDLVVSNPPYVAREELDALQPELGFEPRIALDGGRAGVEVIEALTGQLTAVLKPGGWFFMEIGAGQGNYMLERFHDLPGFESLKVHTDYAGRQRIFQARRKRSIQ